MGGESNAVKQTADRQWKRTTADDAKRTTADGADYTDEFRRREEQPPMALITQMNSGVEKNNR